jgi:hypothetical protein
MVSIRSARGGFSDGGFSRKVVSMTEYDMTMLNQLHMNPANKQQIEKGAANIVSKYFESYIDAKARSAPSRLHHVYEFDRTGQSNSRLFKSEIRTTNSGATITYKFTNARNPNRQGYPFPAKASVMESGETVTIRPTKKQYLTYRLDDGRFVKSTQSVVTQPGGDVAGNFASEWQEFTSTKVKTVLKQLRYFERINSAYRSKRRLIIPRINRDTLSNAKAQAAMDARMVAVQAEGLTSG